MNLHGIIMATAERERLRLISNQPITEQSGFEHACLKNDGEFRPGDQVAISIRKTTTSENHDTLDATHAAEVLLADPQWEAGTLTTRVMERVLRDVLADIWHDVYRRDTVAPERRRVFCQKLASELYAATGQQFRVE